MRNFPGASTLKDNDIVVRMIGHVTSSRSNPRWRIIVFIVISYCELPVEFLSLSCGQVETMVSTQHFHSVFSGRKTDIFEDVFAWTGLDVSDSRLECEAFVFLVIERPILNYTG